MRYTLICLLTVLALVSMATAQHDNRVCLSHSDELKSDTRSSLLAMMDGMKPVFQAFPSYLDLIGTEGTDICLSANLLDALGYFSPEDNSIVIQSELPHFFQIAILIHELRHLQQFATGNCPNDSLAMSESARATFALEADASAISIFIANSLKDAGQPEIWEALSTWPSQTDIVVSFEKELATSGDPRRATTAAFAQWYESLQRRENYYRASCSSYLDRQDRTKALPLYEKVAPDFFESLCRMPDGSMYECQEASDGHRP